MNCKKGNVVLFLSIYLFIVILLIFVFSVCVIYFQINTQIKMIKLEIPVVVKNAVLNSLDKEALKLNEYVFDIKKTQSYINVIFSKQYKNIMVKNINYDEQNNNFDVELEVKFKPLINVKKEEVSLVLKEKVRFENMEVKNK